MTGYPNIDAEDGSFLAMASRTSAERAIDPSAELATFVSKLGYDDIPEEATRVAERCFVDTVAVGLAGASAEAGTVAAETSSAVYGDGPSTLWGRDTAPVIEAAFVNGTASHALDYDDVSTGVDGHPSPTMVAPILAAAEAFDATGSDAITAYVAGFETQSYVAAPNLRRHGNVGLHTYGWHPTAVFGTFGATAAGAVLLDLDAEETRNALNVAASMPAGLKRNFGSLTKPMHSGQAGAAGLRAALLADHGFDATEDALSEGFFPLYERVEDPDPDVFPDLGSEWCIVDRGVDVKKYPSCYATHTSIHATQQLVTEYDIHHRDIESIHLSINGMMDDVLTYDDPRTEAEAKFSKTYPVAAATVFDYIGIETFEPETIQTPAIQRVRELIEYERDPDLGKDTHQVTVTIETNDGGFYSETVINPPARHDDPLSDEALGEKFMACATRTIDQDTAEEALERLDTLREQNDIGAVTRLFRA